jgi:hypothetical protein
MVCSLSGSILASIDETCRLDVYGIFELTDTVNGWPPGRATPLGIQTGYAGG